MTLEKPWHKKQFIGMFDQSGVPIREGDIVHIANLSNPLEKKYVVVSWDNSALGWNMRRWRHKPGISIFVVGSRYKNRRMAKKLGGYNYEV